MVFDPTRRAPLPRGAIVDPARLSALDDLELLDTEPEEAFDRITRLASLCLDTPVALLSLVDHDRQFVKRSVGLPEGLTELPVAGAFCRLSVENPAPLVVADARDDPLVRSDPSPPHDRAPSLAGAPLRTAAAHPSATRTASAATSVRSTSAASAAAASAAAAITIAATLDAASLMTSSFVFAFNLANRSSSAANFSRILMTFSTSGKMTAEARSWVARRVRG